MNYPTPAPQHLFVISSTANRVNMMHRCPLLERLSNLITALNQAELPQREAIAQELAATLKSAALLHTNLPEKILQDCEAVRPEPF